MIGLFSSVIAQVTELSVRGSGSPAGPVGFWTTRSAAAPVGPPASAPTGVVVFSQAAKSRGNARARDRPGGSARQLAPGDAGAILRMLHVAPQSRAATRFVRSGRRRASRKSSVGVVTWFSRAPSTKFVMVSVASSGSGSPALRTTRSNPSI